jgi:hypothetical protein
VRHDHQQQAGESSQDLAMCARDLKRTRETGFRLHGIGLRRVYGAKSGATTIPCYDGQ